MVSKNKPESNPESHMERFEHLVTKVLDFAIETLDDTKARTAAIVVGELRKMKLAEAKSQETLTRSDLLTAARKLEPGDRAALMRDLQQLDARKSGLS